MATAGTITDPQTVWIGCAGYPVTGVLSISWSESAVVIPSPPADGDTYAGAPKKGSTSFSGSITFSNPVLAATALAYIAGQLSASVKGVGGQADTVYTFDNCVLGGLDANVSKDAPASATIPFTFGSTTGSSGDNPVTIT